MSPDVAAAARLLRDRLRRPPEAVVVLGSGLGHLVDDLDDPVEVPFTDAPGFPGSGVAGHAGRWVGGSLAGCPVLLQAGRYHVYEGHPMEVVVAPVRVAAALGVGTLVLTNAAGGADPDLEPGDVVLLHDHLNLMFRSPLIGLARTGEPRFPDMSEPYDAGLRAAAKRAAARLGIPLREGVYAAVTGPSYETAAEVRMIRTLGADVIGMSTVPEVLAARSAGLRCLAFSMVTNKGTGYSAEALSHDEVMAVGREAGARVAGLVSAVLSDRVAQSSPAGETK
ncbi:MAG: purine-nucleoside phosphorylase [Longimicrobiales bacterium]